MAIQDEGPAWVNEPKALAPGVTHQRLMSRRNGREIGYSIYLPPAYEKSRKRLPLVLFLHGAGGSEVSDAVPGGYTSVVESAFPNAVVLFVNGRMSGYMDRPDRSEYIETSIIDELLPYIEKTYRTGGKRELRLLTGFSMGGAGSCRLAMRYPDKFAGAIAWGGSTFRGDWQDAFAKAAPIWRRNGFRLFLGVGENDQFAQADPFRQALAAEGIRHVYRVLPGIGHDLGAYYRLTAKDAFDFVRPGVS